MYDVIVIGAGAVGSAAAYHAAKAGQRVLLLEQFEIDHQNGSSYGYSRIIRYAYDYPQYVRLMKAAYNAWTAFEQDSGEALYVRTGGLDLAPPGEPVFDATIRSLTAEQIPFELLSADEAMRRFPHYRLNPDTQVVYQEDAGALRASKSVRAHVRRAEELGAVVMANTPVTQIDLHADSVTVTTGSGETHSAAKLIVAAGAWLKPLLQPTGITLPLQPIRTQEIYFNAADSFDNDTFPLFIWHLDAEYGRALYGIPSVDGSGVKIAFHGGPDFDPHMDSREPDLSVVEMIRAFADKQLPGAAAAFKNARVCLYTMTPDEHFILDTHPEHSHVVIASCCSGHGFKFSTLLGNICTDLAFTGTTEHDISLFKLLRFASVTS